METDENTPPQPATEPNPDDARDREWDEAHGMVGKEQLD